MAAATMEEKASGNNNFEEIRINHFIRNAQQYDGGESELQGYPLPSWVKPELIKDGQEFVSRNFFAVFFSHFVSLLFLLCYGPVRIVLMQTSKSDTKVKALKRYLSTLIHIKKWYEGNLLEIHETAAQDIYRVRKIHAGVSKRLRNKTKLNSNEKTMALADADAKIIEAIRKDLTKSAESEANFNNNNEDYLLTDEERSKSTIITQLDMAVTQFCFMGFLSLYPTKFGITNNDDGSVQQQRKKEFEGFVHMWAVIGHLLGIQDRFNICLEKNSEMREIILNKVLLVDLFKCHSESVTLWKSLASGMGELVPCISLRAVLLFTMRNVLEFSCSHHVANLLSMYETFCFRLMSWCFNSWIRYSIIRSILNGLLRLAIYLAGKIHFPNKSNISIIFHA